MVTTKEISKKYTQKEMKGESSGLLPRKKNISNIHEKCSNRRNKGQKSYQTYRKQIAKQQKSILINNYFKYI